MNFTDAKNEIRSRWRDIMPQLTAQAAARVNGETSWICPLCGHGAHGDGLTFNRKGDHNTLKCFGCDFTGDVIQLYQQMNAIDFRSAVFALADMLYIDIEQDAPQERRQTTRHKAEFGQAMAQVGQQDPKTISAPNIATESVTGAAADLTNYFQRCQIDLSAQSAQEYLKRRGISPATAAAVGIGYDNSADPANNPAGIPGRSIHPTPRIIIPTSSTHYVAKAISPDVEARYKTMNPRGGSAGIFNEAALYAPEVSEDVFVTEGAFDALSLLEIGRQAIALNSTSNANKLLEILQHYRPKCTLILCMDNDDAGKKAADVLHAGLQRLNISHVTANINGAHKDPNEALTADRAAFIEAVEAAEHLASRRPDNVTHYLDELMGHDIESFGDTIDTGYKNLDEQTGGLYVGLYCIAAVSSLGKTTFMLQMADQIAEGGREVLFFSLEQSRLEMVTKSLARRTWQINPGAAVRSLSIRRGFTPDIVQRAAAGYKDAVGERLSIIDGNFNCKLADIGAYIRQYCRRNDARPVVIIDYLQILQPDTDDRGRKQGIREAMDSAITELKQLSRELRITVIVISSVNRSSYLQPMELESLKESGGIEYTCDVVWGLQFECLHEDIFDKDKNLKEKRERMRQAKAETPRRVELVSLKNRYGRATFSCMFDYYPEFDVFVPSNEFRYSSTETAEKRAKQEKPEGYGYRLGRR